MQPFVHAKHASLSDRDVGSDDGQSRGEFDGENDAEFDRDGDGTTSTSPPADALAGEVAFVSADVQMRRTAELLGRNAVVVNVPPLPMVLRGHLAEHIDERVERELAARGAPSPYLPAWSVIPDDAESRLADQLERARTVGASGIAFILGSLASSATPALDPDDSATLQRLARSTTRAPIVLLVDEHDIGLGGYAAPLPLEVLLTTPLIRRTPSMVMYRDSAAVGEDSLPPESLASESALIPPALLADDDDDIGAGEYERDVETAALVQTHVDAPVAMRAEQESRTADALTTNHPNDERANAKLEPTVEHDETGADDADDAKVELERAPTGGRQRGRDAQRSATAGVPTAGPADYWRAWALALQAARGPQALVALERLFAEAYVPLANAIASGVDDPRAVRAYDEFRRSFDRTYTDAFATFGVTGRRPRLVMDAYEVAAKQTRLHNARATHILVVDSLRYDIGMRVRDLLAERAPGIASLTAETMLWSALPTTTFRQLETLARGMDALREPLIEEGSESLRGRIAENVRRLRVGSRELYKLDVVPAMLAGAPQRDARTSSESVVGSFDDIAEAVADALTRHISALPPRTLLLVVGDHGFCVDRRGQISHGGASPEEVLVPALAYLVGELH